MFTDHIPQGDPCTTCGKPLIKHRAEHIPRGDPCQLCGLPKKNHRVRKRRQQKSETNQIFLGLDGEGQGRSDHKYVLLAASSEDGKRAWWIENIDGLSTVECLDFLLNLPTHNTRAFTYSFNYDLTKILKDLPNDKLYILFRPELRQRTGKDKLKGPKPVVWNGYRLNLQGTKFTIAKYGRYRVIWDVWKFFQSKFVNALEDWKIGDKEILVNMAHMKDKRADFDKESPEGVLKYCLSECRCMATLARKLIDAHTAAGLKLTSFYGAGSSASAMLKVMGVRDKIKTAPKEMTAAVASAFFGGRFENSVIGEIHETVYSYDISSAYPYQLCFLPCLLHGTWEKTTDRRRIENRGVKSALIRYELGDNPRISSWGPFPFRSNDGSIAYPIESGGGWVWREEYLQAEKFFQHVIFKEAYIYHSECYCNPFERIPEYYCERCRIGKEGPGIVIKLGCNSCYGKLAQSVGQGIFNSWIWAGMITSGCRAQILELLGMHARRPNMLMVATDGIYTRERLNTPKPKETGTSQTGKPLGGWEEKIINKGIFVARPGIYFPMNPTKEEIKMVRGRGVGKGVVLENWQKIVDSWRQYGLTQPAKIANVSRFCGAKSCISRSGSPDKGYKYKRANGSNGPNSPSYGQWVTREVEMNFNPMPKRETVNPDGLTLKLRSFPRDVTSLPYSKALVKNEETRMLIAGNQELLEQPDVDFADYESDLDG